MGFVWEQASVAWNGRDLYLASRSQRITSPVLDFAFLYLAWPRADGKESVISPLSSKVFLSPSFAVLTEAKNSVTALYQAPGYSSLTPLLSSIPPLSEDLGCWSSGGKGSFAKQVQAARARDELQSWDIATQASTSSHRSSVLSSELE